MSSISKATAIRTVATAAALIGATLAACDTSLPDEPKAPSVTSTAALTTFEACQEGAVARGVNVKKLGGSDAAARKALETAFALCEDPGRSPENAAFLGAFNSDYAHLGLMFVMGQLSPSEYRALQADRRRKYEAMVPSRAAQQTLAAGDADGDLVADRIDHCPNTPYGMETDDNGCPEGHAPQGDPAITRALAGTTVLYNPSCKDAPPPIMPVPLQWGRGQQTIHATQGYNLLMTRSGGQPPGCEIFYELELRFTNPGLAGAPPVLYTHMVMREAEDLLGATGTATFGLPVNQPLSPGRTAVRDAMGVYSTVSWKVRAVNGSQVASPWSAVRTAGPASSGVKG